MSPIHSAGYLALLLALLLTSAALLLIAVRGDDIEGRRVAAALPAVIVFLSPVAAVSGLLAAWVSADSLIGEPNAFLTVAGVGLALVTVGWGGPFTRYVGLPAQRRTRGGSARAQLRSDGQMRRDSRGWGDRAGAGQRAH